MQPLAQKQSVTIGLTYFNGLSLYCCAINDLFSLEFCQWQSHTDRVSTLNIKVYCCRALGVGPGAGTGPHVRALLPWRKESNHSN